MSLPDYLLEDDTEQTRCPDCGKWLDGPWGDGCTSCEPEENEEDRCDA